MPTVLVADDSEHDRSLARRALEPAGYRVVEAIDGQQAVEVFAQEQPDLVMLDVVMPRLSGLDACRIIKAKSQSAYLPIMMVSTRNSVNARVEGLKTGADDYLGKPYDIDELRARVEALLRVRRSLISATAPSTAPSAEHRLADEFDRATKYSDPLACLRIELDRYTDIAAVSNSTAVELIDRLQGLIQSSVRTIDVVLPVDEKGYMLILPNTHFPGALSVAERIWRAARTLQLPPAMARVASVSIGVSFYPNRDTQSPADLTRLVDLALSRARNEGGARICLFQHQGYLYAPEVE